MGEFTISPWPDMDGRKTVYVAQADGEGGTFPAKDVMELLRGDDAEKALRAYYDKNF